MIYCVSKKQRKNKENFIGGKMKNDVFKNENLKELILKLTQKDIDELMEKSEKEEDRVFYNKLFNLILETKQEELIRKGIF